ncbi:GMC oxidoreductase [Nocardia wallacei]|uniref:GMC oxidoreductase n=1 Tax=Nocardia wallacei TaxID=480035 RepID=UPI002458FCF7|nr:GMC oxidoreductase [Nocardia wallacei]
MDSSQAGPATDQPAGTADPTPRRTGISRRGFVGAATAATALTLIAKPAKVRAEGLTAERRRAVVIGSGFGGGIAAHRLARAGVDTLVLERGLRWPTGPNAETFAHTLSPDKRSTWLANTTAAGAPALFEKFTGIIERVPGVGMDIMCAAGVGGGSLNYHGMTLQPTEENFTRDLPGIEYGPMREIYYPRVLSVLQATTLPDDLWNHPAYESSRRVADLIDASGHQHFRIPLPIDWDFARMELNGQAKPAYTNSDLAYGVNNGGKNTVDVTWLKAAEDTGRVTVAPLHLVRDIARRPDGLSSVYTDRIDTGGTVLERKEIIADAVFLGAGSAGTTRLLMKAKAKNLIGNLPDGIGKNWGSNGDRIYQVRAADGHWGQQGGPACVGVKFWDDPEGPITIIHGTAPLPDLGIATVVGYGSLAPRGEFVYDPGKDDAVLHWSEDYDAALTTRIRAKVDQTFGSRPGSMVIDTTATDKSTWHALGGATIGSACDSHGRVLEQRGLYVVDGALIPGTSGACNPSATIAALAERCMDDILRNDLGTSF